MVVDLEEKKDIQKTEKAKRTATPVALTERAGLTRRQAAEFCGYSEKTFANFAVLRIGPPFRRFRNMTIYLRADLLKWLESLPVVEKQSA